jgi:hypothetical protein
MYQTRIMINPYSRHYLQSGVTTYSYERYKHLKNQNRLMSNSGKHKYRRQSIVVEAETGALSRQNDAT